MKIEIGIVEKDGNLITFNNGKKWFPVTFKKDGRTIVNAEQIEIGTPDASNFTKNGSKYCLFPKSVPIRVCGVVISEFDKPNLEVPFLSKESRVFIKEKYLVFNELSIG